jgi:hypothetical protein
MESSWVGAGIVFHLARTGELFDIENTSVAAASTKGAQSCAKLRAQLRAQLNWCLHKPLFFYTVLFVLNFLPRFQGAAAS